jgi:hypothetical protein
LTAARVSSAISQSSRKTTRSGCRSKAFMPLIPNRLQLERSLE